MSDLKTKPNSKDVDTLIANIEKEGKREDSKKILEIMREITGRMPVMWGDSMIGFGSYHYKYDSGREGDWFITGFSPRKQNISIYIMSGFSDYEKLLKQLGKHKTGKSCLYINKLEDIDQDILREMITRSIEFMESKYECK